MEGINQKKGWIKMKNELAQRLAEAHDALKSWQGAESINYDEMDNIIEDMLSAANDAAELLSATTPDLDEDTPQHAVSVYKEDIEKAGYDGEVTVEVLLRVAKGLGDMLANEFDAWGGFHNVLRGVMDDVGLAVIRRD